MDYRVLAPIQFLFRQFVPKKVLEADIGRLLKTRFGSVVTTYGGAALDVDNEDDFMVIRYHFKQWRDYHEDLYQMKTMAAVSSDNTDQVGPVENSPPLP